ncbi:MAG: hypothetical protein R2715_09960 [Ilumatobacteraceae bacterium]
MFLEKLGLASVADLPPIADFVPGADVVEALEHGLRVPTAPPEAPVPLAEESTDSATAEEESIDPPDPGEGEGTDG